MIHIISQSDFGCPLKDYSSYFESSQVKITASKSICLYEMYSFRFLFAQLLIYFVVYDKMASINGCYIITNHYQIMSIRLYPVMT